MSGQHDPITLETAGVILGGEKPWSRKTVERVIAAGLLSDYGRGGTRRVLRGDAEALRERLARKEVSWPLKSAKREREEIGGKAIVSRPIQRQREGRKKRDNVIAIDRLVARPPKRGS